MTEIIFSDIGDAGRNAPECNNPHPCRPRRILKGCLRMFYTELSCLNLAEFFVYFLFLISSFFFGDVFFFCVVWLLRLLHHACLSFCDLHHDLCHRSRLRLLRHDLRFHLHNHRLHWHDLRLRGHLRGRLHLWSLVLLYWF